MLSLGVFEALREEKTSGEFLTWENKEFDSIRPLKTYILKMESETASVI